MKFTLAFALTLLAAPWVAAAPSPPAMPSPPVPNANWWPQTLQLRLARAGQNRAQLVEALRRVPVEQRAGLLFLLDNMPDEDLRSLSSRFLLDHLAQSYDGYNAAPWKSQIPRSIFFNDVLPYASLTEARDGLNLPLRDAARQIAEGSDSPSAAARRLNEKLFARLQVRYSTARARPDQSARQSMKSGIASCSGLSILLVQACRAVGVPARVVGTPLWANGRGNHTWVEIWDGNWHFLGAAEPDEQGLDHAWFAGDAAQARADAPQNAIYASSFQKTGLPFPLVWAPDVKWVEAVNVTARYAPPKTATAQDATAQDATAQDATAQDAGAQGATASGRSWVLLKVVDANGRRVARNVVVSDLDGHAVFSGTSKSETNDANDYLKVQLPSGGRFRAVAQGQPAVEFEVGTRAEQTLVLGEAQGKIAPADAAALKRALIGYFEADAAQKANWQFAPAQQQLLRAREAQVKQLAWQAYREAAIHPHAREDYAAHRVRFGAYLSPYLVKTVGTRPPNGWGLVIALHGGGGTAKEVNDEQWRGMFSHYKDHPEAGGYRYVALRAPNDTWNGFYDDYVYPLVGNLIEQFTLLGEVNPDKVFVLGYSHGGYGAYAIGPKTPDRFAAVHASAAAATDGETAAKNLRNTPFSAMVGEKDLAYDRLSRNQRFDAEIRALRGERSDIYPVRVDVMAGFEHGNLKDGDQLAEMLPATRNPVPRELTWLMTDAVITRFFWLGTQTPAKTREIDATCRDNAVTVTTSGLDSATVFLDRRLVDFDRPIEFNFNGQKSRLPIEPSLNTLCQTLAERGDINLAFTAAIALPLTSP